MKPKELETQHNLTKWAAIIKECRSSGMRILEWLELNNVSKDQYYYWQRKLKETCIDTLEKQQTTFVELPFVNEQSSTAEITISHSACDTKNNVTSSDNTVAAIIKVNGITLELECVRREYCQGSREAEEAVCRLRDHG